MNKAKILLYTEGCSCDLCGNKNITVTFLTSEKNTLVICLKCSNKINKKMNLLKGYEI